MKKLYVLRVLLLCLTFLSISHLVKAQSDPEPPSITIFGDTIICRGSTLNILGGVQNSRNPTMYWTSSTTGRVNGAVLNIPNMQANGLYTFNFIDDDGNRGSRVVFVQVVNKPFPPIVPPGGLVICQFDQNPELFIPGNNIKWYNSPTSPFGTNIPPLINTSVTGSYTYYVTQSVGACESDRAMVLITVNPKPAPPFINSPMIYCQYDIVKPLTIDGDNLRYYTVPTGGLGSLLPPRINTGYIDTFTYYVSQTVSGCESDRAKIDVQIFPQPSAIIMTDRDSVCQYDTISYTYYGNAPAQATFNWEVIGGEVVSGAGTRGPVVVRYNEHGIGTTRLTVILGSCVSPVAQKDVTVLDAPTAQISTDDFACLDQRTNVSVINSTMGSERFDWNFGNANILYGSHGGPYGVEFQNPGYNRIELVIYKLGCPSLPIIDSIYIDAPPPIQITWNNQSICQGDSVTFKATPYPEIRYMWAPMDNFKVNGAPEAIAKISEDTTLVTLTAKTIRGCEFDKEVTVTAEYCCNVMLPSAFTPNGDGKNDEFGIITDGNPEISSFRVYNRWGRTVFDTNDLNRKWNGTHAGENLDMGVYMYHVIYKCSDGKVRELKGDVTLMR